MTEPDVALTDYLLAAECALFAALFVRRGGHGRALRPWFILFFASSALASALGGTLHGFFSDPSTPGRPVLWRATLLVLGLAGWALWSMSAALVLPRAALRWVGLAAGIVWLGYVCVVLWVLADFRVAILQYGLPTLALAAALIAAALRGCVTARLLGLAGVVLTWAAAAIQQGRVTLHDVYFNHNALYHLVQAGALVLVFLWARAELEVSC
jgi:hypothetical protein